MMKRRLAFFFLALVGTVVLAWVTVPATILPPVAPANPTTVHVVEIGIHARLLMPVGDRWRQYGFGDWDYYARREQDLLSGLQALLWPTPGALGWGEFESLEAYRGAFEAVGGEILSFDVPLERVEELQDSLHSRFDRQIPAGQVFNEVNNLRLVRDDQTYSVFHNSNHELAGWLEALDCRVRHLGLWISFRLGNPTG
ncbi:hypothetical protein [Leptolyngbya sp. KIOST-1]|uniref:hypothetical protein n=1 Tax=Leptolyngbya sp. KIOST-1 TaxID=1229172 RepID=UPI00055C5D6E|nr:hypothetical protein [Leptolyngbya sp. KIOST-1]